MTKPESTHEYTIDGVTFATSRALPPAVLEYIAQWASDPIWDIGSLEDDPELVEYKPELLAYAAAHGPVKEAEWEAKISTVTDLRAMKIAYLRDEHGAVTTRAAIAQAEQLKRIADALIGNQQPATLDATTLSVCEIAIIDSMSNRGAYTEAEFELWQTQCKPALEKVQALLYDKNQAWRDASPSHHRPNYHDDE